MVLTGANVIKIRFLIRCGAFRVFAIRNLTVQNLFAWCQLLLCSFREKRTPRVYTPAKRINNKMQIVLVFQRSNTAEYNRPRNSHRDVACTKKLVRELKTVQKVTFTHNRNFCALIYSKESFNFPIFSRSASKNRKTIWRALQIIRPLSDFIVNTLQKAGNSFHRFKPPQSRASLFKNG